MTGLCTEDDEATLLTDEGPETEGTFYLRIKIRIYNAVYTTFTKKTQLSQTKLATHLRNKSDGVADFLKTPLSYVTMPTVVVPRV